MANAWVNREKIDSYLDRSRNARFSFYQYAVAFRKVQNWYFDQFCPDEKKVRDDLYTLIKYANPAITTIGTPSLTDDLTINHINYPVDYHYFSTLLNYIDGSLIETKPTNYNQLSNLLNDVMRKPSNERCYVLEDSTGWRIFRGYGGAYTNELVYLIAPSEWSIGTETDLIDAGATVLTLGVNYTSTAESESAGIKYEPGEQFSATSTALTTGQVIPTSVMVDSNFPDSTQDELCRRCALLLQGSVKDAFGVNFTSQVGPTDQK
jgi:hypothetical protein